MNLSEVVEKEKKIFIPLWNAAIKDLKRVLNKHTQKFIYAVADQIAIEVSSQLNKMNRLIR